jgi:hypothetical protein
MPTPHLPNMDPATAELLRYYAALEEEMTNSIVSATVNSWTWTRCKGLLDSLDTQVSTILSESLAWDSKHLPAAYHAGMNYGGQTAHMHGVSGDVASVFHQMPAQALKRLAEDAAGQRSIFLRAILRQSRDYLRDLTTGHIARGMGLGHGTAAVGRALRESLIDQQRNGEIVSALAAKVNTATGVIYSNGTVHSLHEYARMATHTGMMGAMNEGSLDMYRALDVNCLRVSTHGTLCYICAPLEGTVFALDAKGEEMGYPSHATISLPQHPNCSHSFEPVAFPDKDKDHAPPTWALGTDSAAKRDMYARFREEHPEKQQMSRQGFTSTHEVAKWKRGNPGVPDSELRGPKYRYSGINARRQEAIATMLKEPGLSYSNAVSRQTRAYMRTEQYTKERTAPTPSAQRKAANAW